MNLIFKFRKLWLYIYNCCGKNDAVGVEKTFNTILTDNQKQLCIKQFYNKKTQKTYSLNKNEYKYPFLMYGNSHPNMSVYGIMILKCQNFTTINNNSVIMKK